MINDNIKLTLSSRHFLTSLLYAVTFFSICSKVHADAEHFNYDVKNFMVICDPDYVSSPGTTITQEDAANFLCDSYLSGNLDGIVTTLTMIGAKNLICLPTEGVSNKGLIRMLRNFIKSKGNEVPPEFPLRGLIFSTLANYFPCSKK
jgi:hypothetical protein